MHISRYLERIKYDGVVYNDLPTLQSLQRNHVFAIPFETLDIYHHVPIILQIESLYKKVILENRGGYCYELNVLFHHLLSVCGFKVSMIAGRLLHGRGYGRPFEHMALVVELEERKWLVDVGYGDFSLKPLAITPGEVQSDGRTTYQILEKVVVDGEEYLAVAKWKASKRAFKTEYIFTLTPRVLQEFSGMNHFHQTSQESHFARSLICSLPTAEGRISIINNQFIRTENGDRQVKAILNDAHREEILKDYFYGADLSQEVGVLRHR
ncbi:MAG TPA: arylamine N-acetyltransferase [Puia sp.]|nr:arylamine N-acetyltransferase [Puia sp.]